MAPTEANPPIASRLRITHGLLETLARECGARVLHIKGEALHPILAQARTPSSDCDVLVHPADMPAYKSALESNGWQLRTHFADGSVFAHAATFYHPVWGTVDLHRSFPGVDANPRATFEAWWNHRESIELGGSELSVPSLLDQRLLLLLHAGRNETGSKSHDFNVTWANATIQERDELEKRALELGAAVPLLVITDCGDGTRLEAARGGPHFHLWEAVNRNANPTEIWRAQLSDATTLADKARISWRAMQVNRDHLALQLGHTPSAREVRREWCARIGRGAQRLATLVVSRRHTAKPRG